MGYQTLFEYIVESIDRKYNISEAKIDTEYERNFNQIPRDVFDTIVLMDPKTQVSGDEIKNMGFGSKQLLLPKYISGETDFVNNGEAVTAALANYYPNIASYPKFNEFRSVADFLTFMANPEGAEIEKVAQESPLDKLYNKYYSSIERDIFNKIIAMDPKTADDKIGEIAKNLLLISYMKGEHDFIDQAEAVTAAINTFYEKGHNYPEGKDNIQNFESVAEFIVYKPTSPTVAALADKGISEGTDYEIIASTAHVDVFKILTWEGSREIAHARGARNVWCTAGGDSGRSYLDSDGISSYYKSYSPRGSRQTQLYEIISRENPTSRIDNYNLALRIDNSAVYEFRDGNNNCRASDHGPFFKSIILADPDLVTQLKNCSDPIMRRCPEVSSAYELLRYNNEPLIINSKDDFSKLLGDSENIIAMRACVKEIQINNVETIPFGLFANFVVLETLVLSEGLKSISSQAFKNCANLKTITLPESLESIGVEAFAGCSKLKGSIRIPDGLINIGERAFAETHCRLKVNKARTAKLKMSPKDMDWIKTHVQSIKV